MSGLEPREQRTGTGRRLYRPEQRRIRPLMILKRPGGNGGMQQQARRVAGRMRQGGVPVRFVSESPGEATEPVVRSRWLPTTFLDQQPQAHFLADLYRHLLRYQHAYDVVHVHGFGGEAFAAIAAKRRTGKPLVVKPSTAGPGTKLHIYGYWSPLVPFSRRFWDQVDAWISISSRTRADLERLGVRPERIVDLPNGVDCSRYRPLPPEERAALRSGVGLGPDDVLICTAARLTPHKKVDLLVRAFLQVAPRFPNAHLWVMGDGEQSGEVEALAASSEGRIRVLGHLGPPRARAIMQAADIFALLSLWEGLSNALLEGMASGLAPLVTDVSGMADVVTHEQSGVLVRANDEDAAAQALARLLGDGALRQRLAHGARARVQRDFSLDATVQRLLDLYGRLKSARETR